MTEDYKKQLIDYTTGLLNNENPDPKDFNILNIDFQEYKDSFSDFFTELSGNARGLRITGILENENYDISILYGGFLYGTTSTPGLRGRGFLIYLDKNNNVLKVLFKDKNNNYLKGFHKLYLDEENNRVYGVLGHPTISPVGFNEPNYFCYITNLFLPNLNGEYEVDINKSYDLEENEISIKEIVKDPEHSSYLMIGSNANALEDIKAIEYKVNVGESNEIKKWNILPSTSQVLGSYGWTTTALLSYYLWFTNETPHFKVIFGGLNYSTDYMTYYGKYYGIAVDNGNNISYTRLNQITDIIPNNSSIWSLSKYQLEVLGINENEIYFVVIYENYDSDTNLNYFQTRIHQYNGTTINTLYNSPSVSVPTSGWHNHDCYYFNFYIDTDGTRYLVKYYTEENTSRVYTSLLNFTKYYNDIGGNHWEDLLAQSYDGADKIYSVFTITQRNYNLQKIFNIVGDISSLIFIQANLTGYIMTITNLYNSNNYNGTPYYSVDGLSPQYVNLYNNNSILFSRNLYNITMQNNQSTSSVEIPSNYLNDLPINESNLISKTNVELVNDTEEWTKNIYEIVDLNFINTIRVIDEDINKEYMLSAIKLNYSTINGGQTNYDNTKCVKYRINYEDNTSSIGDLTWQPINDTNKKVKFIIYVDKAIKNIDLISYDETTIYMTINGTFTIGKVYIINQKIRIE